MGLFDIFTYRPQSYHWSESQGRMVKCASTPCRLHGQSDVMCASQEEAEAAHRRMIEAREKAAAEEAERRKREEARKHEHPWDRVSDDLLAQLHIDPDIHKARSMYSKLFTQGVTALTPFRICGRHYMPSTNGIAGYCRLCHGTGKSPDTVDRKGNPIDCTFCYGSGYSTVWSDPPHEAVTAGRPMNEEERKFQDFAREHHKEFDRLVNRLALSGSYLSDPALDQSYGAWHDRDLGPMMASDPDQALNLMRSLSDRYDKDEKDWQELVASDQRHNDGVPDTIKPLTVKYRLECTTFCKGRLLSAHEYTSKNGNNMAAYVIYVEKPDQFELEPDVDKPWAALVYTPTIPLLGKGDKVCLRGRIDRVEAGDKGMPLEVMILTTEQLHSTL